MVPPAAPSWTDQVQAVSEEPVTLQVKLFDPPATTLVDFGLTVTATAGGGGAAVTVTVAVALFVGSALLVATTW
jgi:hypothetical protein